MISVFESEFKMDTDAVAQELRAAGIDCFVDGQATAALSGFYVPQVLRVCVLDASEKKRTQRIADEVSAQLHYSHSSGSKDAPRQWGWVVWMGIALVSLGAGGALLALIASIGRRVS
jgi:hypothetical protein